MAQFYYEHFSESRWRYENHINLKIDADALNRSRRRFCVRRTIIISIQDSQGSMLVSAHASTE
jgi:hypothetical protein